MTWRDLDVWWMAELESDPTYEREIYPQLVGLLDPRPDCLYLDLGCGTGRFMREILKAGSQTIGCDLNQRLLGDARSVAPVVRAELPVLAWLKADSVDGICLGLVLEHIEDEVTIFQEAARVSRAGGVLALVINHPIWTAPTSSPIEDGGGEVLYRTGTYFGRGYSDEPAGEETVRFYHRTTSDLLNAASRAGWDLERIEESGLSEEQLSRHPEYAGQEQIPRLMGLRWVRRPKA